MRRHVLMLLFMTTIIQSRDLRPDNNNNNEVTDTTTDDGLLDLLVVGLENATTKTQKEENESDHKQIGSENSDVNKVDLAVDFGFQMTRELREVVEPKLYRMGLILDKDEPASQVAKFGAPTKKSMEFEDLGYVALQASRKIAETLHENGATTREALTLESRLLESACPLNNHPRCSPVARRYRTSDGTCNNPRKPWRGAAPMPMHRFLPPVYEDGIQEIRRSVLGGPLPSPRELSSQLHRDENRELSTVTLMLVQWGQFIDHDVTSTVKSRSFNGSTPRCCARGGHDFLPLELTHPNCFPIEIPPNDPFFTPLRCMEFVRSAPTTRLDCDLGYREQLNQVTSYIDASAIYGSDIQTSDSIRTFANGKILYGRPGFDNNAPLHPPDPPGGELCRSGALIPDCIRGGDERFGEQPGLLAIHTIFVRYHNRVAEILGQFNGHWSDEKIFQETRRIMGGLIQHVTYREFLPIILGREVVDSFGLELKSRGYFGGYDEMVNPTVANAFSTAAFRFGHSMVQNSLVRFDSQHRPIFNNVSLHEEQQNIPNIWSFGSLDRLLLGLCNQKPQRRDEFICRELSNHLFASPAFPTGMDLTAINIQRGRDHGIPPYTSWRQPCGLKPILNFSQLSKIMSPETARRFQLLYRHVDDIDLFSGGLAEKPVRGGLVGPTFACIIAQQFSNLRKGDRFWYENGGFEASFTPAQLQQIRRVTLGGILCQTLTEVETVQPFVFLTADEVKNVRLGCGDSSMQGLDLEPWIDLAFDNSNRISRARTKNRTKTKTRTTTTTKKPGRKTTRRPIQIKVTNITTSTVPLTNKQKQQYDSNIASSLFVVDNIPNRPTYDNYPSNNYDYHSNSNKYTTPNDVTYLFGYYDTTTPRVTPKPIEVNIKIQYYPPQPITTTTTTTRKPTNNKNKRPSQTQNLGYHSYSDDYSVVYKPRPTQTQTQTNDYGYNSNFNQYTRPTHHQQQQTNNKRPSYYDKRPTQQQQQQQQQTSYYNNYPKRPTYYYDNGQSPLDSVYSDLYNNNNNNNNYDYTNDKIGTASSNNIPNPIRPIYSIGYVEKISSDQINDKLDFQSNFDHHSNKKLVKISSVKGHGFVDSPDPPNNILFHVVSQREGSDLDLYDNDSDNDNDNNVEQKPLRLVKLRVEPSTTGNNWMVYNEIDNARTDSMTVPDDINGGVACSFEVPRPMTVKTTTNDTVTRRD